MGISYFSAIKTTGGTAGALDDIIHTNISDGDAATVVDAVNNVVYHYTYDTSNASVESDPDIINPDSNAGEAENYRWVLTKSQTFSSFIRGVIDSDSLTEFLNGVSLEYDEMFITAGGFKTSTTNGVGSTTTSEYSDTGTLDVQYLTFGATTDEYAFINFTMPPTWDRSTIKLKFYWLPASGCSQGDIVTWGADGVAKTNDDDFDGVAHGTSVTVDDTVTAGKDGDLHVSGATGALTIAGTPALGDLINLRIYRDANGSEGSDDMAEDAYLVGVLIQYKRTNTVAAW